MRALRLGALVALLSGDAAFAEVKVGGAQERGGWESRTALRADVLAGASGATSPGFPVGYQLQFHGGVPLRWGLIPELGMEVTLWSSGPSNVRRGGLFAGAQAGLRWTADLGCFRPWAAAHLAFPRLFYSRSGHHPSSLVPAMQTAIGLDSYFGGGVGLVVFASVIQNLWSAVQPGNYFTFGLGLVLAR